MAQDDVEDLPSFLDSLKDVAPTVRLLSGQTTAGRAVS